MRNLRVFEGRAYRPRAELIVCLALVSGLLIAAPVGARAGAGSGLRGNEEVTIDVARSHKASGLSNGELRRAVARMRDGRSPGEGITTDGNRIVVEVLHELTRGKAIHAVENLGGRVTGSVGDELVQAEVPFGRLVALEATAGVTEVRRPLLANVLPDEDDVTSPITPGDIQATDGAEVVKTNADAWHAAGLNGAGVKVGIIDYFGGTKWNSSVAAGDLVGASGTFCRYQGQTCDVWAQNESHGVAVGEVIHEMAPDAQLYVATVGTASDMQAAVDYFKQQGVTIISRSLTAEYDGPGDGTGPIATVIDNAVAGGITWFNSAGNNAGSGADEGSYWRGTWQDANANGWLDFAPGDELMGFRCLFSNGLRWSDWGAGKTDYDLYVYDTATSTTPVIIGNSDQAAVGALPLEHASYNCNANDPIDYLAIHLYAPGSSGTQGDTLEYMMNGGGVEYWQNPYSASGPASDSASPGALSIGAVDPANGTTIANYSAWGPTNDNRTKPDLSAAACVYSHVYAPDCFNGTSSATPVTAGAAALVKGADLAATPSALKTYLLTNAFVDRGDPGTDNVYGKGELLLPDPPGGGGGGATYRPDAQVKRSGSYFMWKGNDIYNTSGRNQMWGITGPRGVTTTFNLKVQNDGDTADSFAIQGMTRSGFSVTYLRGRTNITTAVLDGTYATPPLAPGSSYKITMRVRPGRSATPGYQYPFKIDMASFGAWANGTGIYLADTAGVKYNVRS